MGSHTLKNCFKTYISNFILICYKSNSEFEKKRLFYRKTDYFMFKKFLRLKSFMPLFFVLVVQACDQIPNLVSLERSADGKNVSKDQLLVEYYKRLEKRKLEVGLLRQDGGGADTPFDSEDITQAFEQLAFFNEYSISKSKLETNLTPVLLAKWNTPINIATKFGSSVTRKEKNRNLKEIGDFSKNLSEITDHKIEMSEQNANMFVIFGNQEEVPILIEEISFLSTQFDTQKTKVLSKLPKDIQCLAMTSVKADTNGNIVSALIIIRSELPTLLKKACIQEEIAQGLGLSNDSHLARPSIFNDDYEFATLTEFDKILLKILYDKRLKSGSSFQNSSDIIKQISMELEY